MSSEAAEAGSERHVDEEMESEGSGENDDDDESEDSSDDMEEEDGEEVEAKAFIPGAAQLEEGEELVMDDQAYVVYHQAHLGPPCLSFDVVPDDLGQDRCEYPLSLYGVAGTQATKVSANCIITFKMFNLHPIKRREEEEEDDEEEEQEEEEEEKLPKLKVMHKQSSVTISCEH